MSGSRRRVVIAGSTGSIGVQALEVARAAPERFEIVGLGAFSSVAALAEQAREFRPSVVALADAEASRELAPLLPEGTEVYAGAGALEALARLGDVVLNAVVGFAGMGVTVAALESGSRLALANKESLVAGAPVVQRVRSTDGAELIPVDSEHCAIHQCLSGREVYSGAGAGAGSGAGDVARLVVTASGGPFRGKRLDQLASVTIADALAHPTWKMGPKITVDSSTLMNKGLEVLEAHELFGIGFDRIEVVVHPQSIIHSMVEFSDGATLAQLSQPDMRLPIGYALSYPDRLATPYGSLNWSEVGRLDFEPPDFETFSCLSLAFEAGRAGGSAPAWMNAANEVAVAAFLEGRLSWNGIADVVAETLAAHEPADLKSVEDVLAADGRAREVARIGVARRERAA